MSQHQPTFISIGTLRSGRPAYAEHQTGEDDFFGGLASIAKPDDEKGIGASQYSSWLKLPDTPCGFNPAYAEHQAGEDDFFGGLASIAKPDDEKGIGASQYSSWQKLPDTPYGLRSRYILPTTLLDFICVHLRTDIVSQEKAWTPPRE